MRHLQVKQDSKQQGKKKVAVVGATGYTGHELLRILSRHPQVELTALTSRSHAGKNIQEVFPSLKSNLDLLCRECRMEELADEAELIFIALPHGEAASMLSKELLLRTKVLDLGADFRLHSVQQYQQWYHLEHANPALIEHAVYGLPEFYASEIAQASLIANPGCYSTCSILSLAPILKEGLIDPDSIIIDAKSGVSGAGRGLSLGTHFNEVNENIKAYALTSHRHTPEIEQELSRYSGRSAPISFTPHLIPMQRGILVTAYANLSGAAGLGQVSAAYRKAYEQAMFIRVYDPLSEALPETRWVRGSNYCDIAFRIDQRRSRLILVACLDNLIKGAAGQAVQNMNLMFGFAENCGLEHLPAFP